MSKALEGEHLCLKHQGNHSHYAEHNCTICVLQAEIAKLKEQLKAQGEQEPVEMANKMISDLKDSLRLNANTVMSLTTKLYAMHDAITALMDNSEEFEFDDGIGRGAQQRYWDEVNEAINEAAPPIHTNMTLVNTDTLYHLFEYWNGSTNETDMENALNYIQGRLGDLCGS